MELGLEGKACIVTGGSRGIGLATAKMLAAEDADVLVAARNAHGVPAGLPAVELDVTEPDAGERLVAECEARFGRVDVVVNNAGTTRVAPLGELKEEDWQEQWELNVLAPMRLMRAACPRMAERGSGRVVNVCSSSGKRPSLTNAAYSVTKAAQLSLSRVFADAFASQGVLVNAVAPGPIETPLWLDRDGLADQAARARGVSPAEAFEAQREKIPLGRFGTAEEVAAVVVFLCSRRAGNVAGAAWSVDGGSVPVIL
jgi:3-oxoacyl-[acyl-carrier protein] reductase